MLAIVSALAAEWIEILWRRMGRWPVRSPPSRRSGLKYEPRRGISEADIFRLRPRGGVD